MSKGAIITGGVINVPATVSGIVNPGGAFVGSSLISPTQATFAAGTYTATITTPLVNGSAVYTAWTYNVNALPMPYFENFEAFNDNGGSPITAPIGAAIINYMSTTTFSTAALAYADSLVVGSVTFTLPATTTLDFVVPDNILSDNAGGVSVLITQTTAGSTAVVPEPVSAGLVGLVGLGLLRRRRRV